MQQAAQPSPLFSESSSRGARPATTTKLSPSPVRKVSPTSLAANQPTFGSRPGVAPKDASTRLAAQQTQQENRRIADQQQMKADSLNVPHEEFLLWREQRIIALTQRITAIKSASFAPYFILFLADLFRTLISVIEVIPLIGIGISLVFSFFMMIIALVCTLFLISTSPIDIRSKFALRLLMMCFAYFLSGILPIVDFIIPFTLGLDVLLILLYKRDLFKARKDVEKERAELVAVTQ